MDDSIINIDHKIAEVNNQHLLDFKIIDWKKLGGGTSSNVWKLTGDNDNAYVYKENEREVILEELLFLKTYEYLKILPEIVYIDENQQYYIYKYMEGEIKDHLNHKKDNLHILVDNLIIHSQPFSENKWGYTYQRYDSFKEFLLSEVHDAWKMVGTVLPSKDYELVKSFVDTRDVEEIPYLLHGDCGVHNFLQKNDQLIGVIDPLTLAGPPLFELVFAFCSSPDHLTYEVIYDAARKLPTFTQSKKYLVEEVLIGLYLRIERCLYHHPDDLPAYLKAWNYWNSLLALEKSKNASGI
ncbi:aminoglycoside phosphotransferase family protein [Lederbergia panacisoli]|uniref:aminoglycoside phosphotransferase family protein n=1 Tax=Lederbergia panacisoli TaxID=1255251 RepID=UPI00214D0E99|nr:aminoglycoside phosphotransferase family protein [Lederbergia panacisoli]MCR2823144.1 aminoglycoside phosphotransferase family protein [Lederbergia panacisoli]